MHCLSFQNRTCPVRSPAWRYHGTTHVSLPPPLRAAASGLGLVVRYPRPGFLPWRRQDLPSSWGTPIPVCACSPTPAGRGIPNRLRNARVVPVQGMTKTPTTRIFRGSIAWLSGSLPAYHALVSRRGARLASRRWSGSPGRAYTRRAPAKGFNSHHVSDPPFPSFLAQSAELPSGQWPVAGERDEGAGREWAVGGGRWERNSLLGADCPIFHNRLLSATYCIVEGVDGAKKRCRLSGPHLWTTVRALCRPRP